MKIGQFISNRYGIWSTIDLYKKSPEDRSEYFISFVIGIIAALFFGAYFLLDAFGIT